MNDNGCIIKTVGFFGVNGITVENGYTTPDEEEARIKKAAMLRCCRRIVLTDPSKFVSFASLDEADILTTALPDSRYTDKTTIMEVDRL